MKRTAAGPIVESVPTDEEDGEMDTPDDNPAKYCRLCFSIAQPLEPIFSNPRDQGGFVAQLIRESMTVPLIAQEDFPCAVCRECYQKMHEFQRFRQQFYKLNQIVCRKREAKRKAAPAKKTKKKSEPIATPATVVAPPPSVVVVVDSTTGNGIDLLSKECIELSDDDDDDIDGGDPVVSNGPSAETAEDTDDDQPYIALDDDWFCCRQCNRMFQTLAVMMDHLRDNHPGTVNVYSMPPRWSAFIGDQANIMHEVMSEGLRYFKCNDCDTLLRQKGNMIKHWTRFHKEAGVSQKLYCSVPGCVRFFMDGKSYRRHLTIHHGISDPSKIVKYQAKKSK